MGKAVLPVRVNAPLCCVHTYMLLTSKCTTASIYLCVYVRTRILGTLHIHLKLVLHLEIVPVVTSICALTFGNRQRYEPRRLGKSSAVHSQ